VYGTKARLSGMSPGGLLSTGTGAADEAAGVVDVPAVGPPEVVAWPAGCPDGLLDEPQAASGPKSDTPATRAMNASRTRARPRARDRIRMLMARLWQALH